MNTDRTTETYSDLAAMRAERDALKAKLTEAEARLAEADRSIAVANASEVEAKDTLANAEARLKDLLEWPCEDCDKTLAWVDDNHHDKGEPGGYWICGPRRSRILREQDEHFQPKLDALATQNDALRAIVAGETTVDVMHASDCGQTKVCLSGVPQPKVDPCSCPIKAALAAPLPESVELLRAAMEFARVEGAWGDQIGYSHERIDFPGWEEARDALLDAYRRTLGDQK